MTRVVFTTVRPRVFGLVESLSLVAFIVAGAIGALVGGSFLTVVGPTEGSGALQDAGFVLVLNTVIGLNIINSAVVILFVYDALRGGETAPILVGARRPIADPVPQALMLTAIVIGVSLTALALGLVYRLYVRYGTLDVREIKRAAREDGAGAPHDEPASDRSRDTGPSRDGAADG